MGKPDSWFLSSLFSAGEQDFLGLLSQLRPGAGCIGQPAESRHDARLLGEYVRELRRSMSVMARTSAISGLTLPFASSPRRSPSGGSAYFSSLTKYGGSNSATAFAASPTSPPS
jgi:hypothetical protein